VTEIGSSDSTQAAPEVRHQNPTVSAPTRKKRLTAAHARVLFFAIILVIMLGYTGMAFQLEWITSGGRVGPGFFPRIIGSISVVICVGALISSLRGSQNIGNEEGFVEDQDADHSTRKYPVATTVAISANFILVATLTTLGAVVSSALFMFGMLAFLNRGRWLFNVVTAVSVPLIMYLLFSTALNAELPSGIMP